ncbi:MAG: hypothetical protein GXZ02_03340 [Clostridiales bacterium]|nr:hypothetical protein [Clostridiales bacterium]
MRVGFLKQDSAEDLAEYVGNKLCAEVEYCDGGKKIETVALCGGAGGSLVDEVIEAGIDAYITGEVSYHHFLSAADNGLTIIAAGHFETENPIVQVLADQIRRRFEDLEVSVLEQDLPVDVYLPDLLR